MNRITARLVMPIAVCCMSMLLTGCSNNETDFSNSPSEAISIMEQATLPNETTSQNDVTMSGETTSSNETMLLNEAESQRDAALLDEPTISTSQTEASQEKAVVTKQPFSYSSDEVWHTPRFVYRQKYPFCINDVIYAENREVFYIASEQPEIHVIDAVGGGRKSVYQLTQPATYLLWEDNKLYCLSAGTVEIWDTLTSKCLGSLSYQGIGLDEFDSISDAMVSDDDLYLLRGNCILKIHLPDGASEFCDFRNGQVQASQAAELEYSGCVFDSKGKRIVAKSDEEDMVYCLDAAEGVRKTFEVTGDTMFFVNDVTGTLFLLEKVMEAGSGCSIACKMYDSEYNMLKETSWNLGDDSYGVYSDYIPLDATDDDRLLLLQEEHGNMLVLNMDGQDNYQAIENDVKDYVPAAFVNAECVFFTDVNIGVPWKLYNITTGMYLSNQEISGYCRLAQGKDSFLLYKSNGNIALYSHGLSDGTFVLPEKPELVTNPFVGGLWTENNGEKVAVISCDGKYEISWELTEEKPEHYVNCESDVYCSYWMNNKSNGEKLYCIQFPTDSFVSVAVKNDSCAAIVDRAGVYYEFNPRNGEVYRSGMFAMPLHADLQTVQFVVDFEKQYASIIYKTSNFSYEGALYSTETFERLFEYGATSGYMMTDLACDKVYYRDFFSKEHLLLELSKIMK